MYTPRSQVTEVAVLTNGMRRDELVEVKSKVRQLVALLRDYVSVH